MLDIVKEIAATTSLPHHKVSGTVELLKEGCTIPFISRYRKEVTGNLTETEVRAVSEQFDFFTELEERKTYILDVIDKQGKLTDELKVVIEGCRDKNELEDLYLPYKPKRRTKAQIARELGFEPLALLILAQETMKGQREDIIAQFKNEEKGIVETDAIMQHALFIVAEEINHHVDARKELRDYYVHNAVLETIRKEGSDDEKSIFRDYYDYREPMRIIKSHRLLAANRGERENILSVTISIDNTAVTAILKKHIIKNTRHIFTSDLADAIDLAYNGYLHPSLSNEVRAHYSAIAEAEAIDVFEKNLYSLIMASPAAGRTIMGIDPGLRTGSKVVIVDKTGKYITDTVVGTLSERDIAHATITLERLIMEYEVSLVAVGNGKGSKEVGGIIRDIISRLHAEGRELYMSIVNESGASIYSASPFAVSEFPHLDVTVRGAISIARRLQDPLSEFVKIDPKSLGVGQYQHDVDQKELKRRLDMVVMSAVNSVGVDVNTASIPLLSYVSGISEKIATEIVKFREERGTVSARDELLSIKGLGAKTFEQCAGFLRVRNGKNPLDNTAIHPESYNVVEKMCKESKINVNVLLQDTSLLTMIDAAKYMGEVGQYTINDIIEELKRPGRDVRSEFVPAPYSDEISDIKDVQVGMMLDGVVTNITKFGLFVDLGIGISGLCHISQCSSRFISDLSTAFSVGDRKKFKVIEVDISRDRIALSLKDL